MDEKAKAMLSEIIASLQALMSAGEGNETDMVEAEKQFAQTLEKAEKFMKEAEGTADESGEEKQENLNPPDVDEIAKRVVEMMKQDIEPDKDKEKDKEVEMTAKAMTTIAKALKDTQDEVKTYGEVIETIAKAFMTEEEKNPPKQEKLDKSLTLEDLMKALNGKSDSEEKTFTGVQHRESPIAKSRDAIAKMGSECVYPASGGGGFCDVLRVDGGEHYF